MFGKVLFCRIKIQHHSIYLFCQKLIGSDTNVNGYILLIDDTDTIIRKFKRAVTDSDAKVEFKEGKDGINNLISIYVAATGKTIDETVAEFDGKGYGDFKLAVGEAVADMLGPVTKKYNDLLANKDYLMQVYKGSAEIAEKIAMRTMRKVYKKIGFTEK